MRQSPFGGRIGQNQRGSRLSHPFRTAPGPPPLVFGPFTPLAGQIPAELNVASAPVTLTGGVSGLVTAVAANTEYSINSTVVWSTSTGVTVNPGDLIRVRRPGPLPNGYGTVTSPAITIDSTAQSFAITNILNHRGARWQSALQQTLFRGANLTGLSSSAGMTLVMSVVRKAPLVTGIGLSSVPSDAATATLRFIGNAPSGDLRLIFHNETNSTGYGVSAWTLIPGLGPNADVILTVHMVNDLVAAETRLWVDGVAQPSVPFNVLGGATTMNWGGGASPVIEWAIGSSGVGSGFMNANLRFLYLSPVLDNDPLHFVRAGTGGGCDIDLGTDGTLGGAAVPLIFLGGRQGPDDRTLAETTLGINDLFNQGTGGAFTNLLNGPVIASN
jgi:hypothetical protein